MNQSREEDGTQNTSISSLSTHGEEDPRMPPVHTRLFMDGDYHEEYNYSSDDNDDCTGVVGRTRLNFNLMLSPKMPMQKDESPFKEIRETSQKGKSNDLVYDACVFYVSYPTAVVLRLLRYVKNAVRRTRGSHGAH